MDVPQLGVPAQLTADAGRQLLGVEGLGDVVVGPMESPRILSESSLLADRTITGRFRFSRIRSRAVRPSSFGIITSSKMRSTGFVSARSTAARPSAAFRHR